MSTGAWIFSTAALVLAVAAPVSYAATTSRVIIGSRGSSNTAHVTSQHQLLSTAVSPQNVIKIGSGPASTGCNSVYTPPPGRAIVVTGISYDMYGGTSGDEMYLGLANSHCSGSSFVDILDTDQAVDSQYHAFPTGIPLRSVGIYWGPGVSGGSGGAFLTGYLIPASQVPRTATPSGHVRIGALHHH
jgi:hypothetical protein